MTRVEHCIYVAPPTKYRPQGYKVIKMVTDQYGVRRKVSEVFRGRDALDRARRCRDEIESAKRKQRLYRDPVKKVDKAEMRVRRVREGSLDALWGLASVVDGDAPVPEAPREATTLKRYMMYGLRADLTIDLTSPDRGYLRRIIEETGEANQEQKLAIWSVIKDWGAINHLRVDEIKGDHIDNFVRHLEGMINKNGSPYSATSIRRYRMELMSIIKSFASHSGAINPLDRNPPSKKPSRIKGEEESVKVPTMEEMTALELGLQERLKNTNARYHGNRQWAWHIHQILRETGCRPGEILALTERAIDRQAGCLTISEAISDGEVGLTKTGKAKGSRSAGTRVVYVTPETMAVIDNWIAIRGGVGFRKSDLIFATKGGTPASDDALRKHYKATGSNLTPYQMRHWRNDQLRRWGVPSEIRQAALGHLSDEINSNYTNVRPEELKRFLTTSPKED